MATTTQLGAMATQLDASLADDDIMDIDIDIDMDADVEPIPEPELEVLLSMSLTISTHVPDIGLIGRRRIRVDTISSTRS